VSRLSTRKAASVCGEILNQPDSLSIDRVPEAPVTVMLSSSVPVSTAVAPPIVWTATVSAPAPVVMAVLPA
jgi:hypothetical protein